MTPSPTKDPDTQTLKITLQDLSKRFNREWIFRHLHYEFLAGKTYAITGPNGSGKSTLLQVIWGQLPQTSGTIVYRKGNAEISVDDIFRYISIATPYMDLIEEFTLAEMLKFHFKLKKLRSGISLEDLPEIMYLENSLEKQLVNFSSGMKQRLKLAMAFYTDAEIYFLDEPGTNLDRQAFAWYTSELKKLPTHAITLIASNNPEEYPDGVTSLQIMEFKA